MRSYGIMVCIYFPLPLWVRNVIDTAIGITGYECKLALNHMSAWRVKQLFGY